MGSGNTIFLVICLFCALTFLAMALWAFMRKTPMHFWSGSRVSPDEITNIPAYNRANGLMWAAYAAGMALSGIVGLFSIGAGTVLLLIFCLPGIGVLILVYKLIYRRYRNPFFTAGSSPLSSKTSKWVIIAASAGTIIILMAACLIFIHGDREPEIDILSDRVQIKGMYGLRIPLSEINSVTLIRDSMDNIGVGTRTNGYRGFSDALKGHFNSADTGQTLLFVRAKTAPTIKIERTGKKDIYISFKDSAETERVYRELREVRH